MYRGTKQMICESVTLPDRGSGDGGSEGNKISFGKAQSGSTRHSTQRTATEAKIHTGILEPFRFRPGVGSIPI